MVPAERGGPPSDEAGAGDAQQPAITQASLSPDGSTVGVVFADASLRFYDSRTGMLLPLPTPPAGAQRPYSTSFFSSGSRLS